MKRHSLLNKIVSLAVCCGALLSHSAVAFEGPGSQIARDVELSGAGHLTGAVCTPEGLPLTGRNVQLKYQGAVVAETTSGRDGQFAFSGVRGGVHELSVDSTSSQVRLWKHGTAPVGANRQVAVTVGDSLVRGQMGPGFVPFAPGFGFMTAVSIASVAVATTSVVVAVDAQNEADDLRAQLSSP
ncbi:MAG: hypothetical protein ACKO2L_11835 [Planctomycetaceae bacterium]